MKTERYRTAAGEPVPGVYWKSWTLKSGEQRRRLYICYHAGGKLRWEKIATNDVDDALRRREALVHERGREDALSVHLSRRHGELGGIGMRYPEVPMSPRMRIIEEPRLGVPVGPGIYFVWAPCGEVEYVGQSTSLQSRVTLKHERIFDGDRATWLELPLEGLDFAECYYIALCRPCRNFGKRAKWRGAPYRQSEHRR